MFQIKKAFDAGKCGILNVAPFLECASQGHDNLNCCRHRNVAGKRWISFPFKVHFFCHLILWNNFQWSSMRSILQPNWQNGHWFFGYTAPNLPISHRWSPSMSSLRVKGRVKWKFRLELYINKYVIARIVSSSVPVGNSTLVAKTKRSKESFIQLLVVASYDWHPIKCN